MKLFARNLLLSLLLAPLSAMSQEAEPESGDPESPASQETDVSEDNYRRYMELQDVQLERPNQPYASMIAPPSLEKLERLPKDSQRHLRDQLRGIILDNERWTPEDAGEAYAYTPSAAAENDSQLASEEAEAWSELVANYHAREAEIYQANAQARSGGGVDGPDRGQDPGKQDQAGEMSETAADGRRQRSGQASAQGSASSQQQAQAAPREAGVTQNALEYLTGSPSSAGPSQATVDGARREPAASASSHAGAPDATQAAAASAGAQSATSEATASEAQTAAAESAAMVTENRAQESASESSTQGDPEGQREVIYRSEGVIAIRDLDKVRGVGTSGQAHRQDADDEEERQEGEDDG